MPDHTPGPWIFNENTLDIIAANGKIISDSEWDSNDPEQVANIRLILAAPDLLAACQAVLNAMAFPRIDSKDRSLFEQLTDACNQCILALEKSTGKEANFEK